MELTESLIKQIVEECRAPLPKLRLPDDEAELFLNNVSEVLEEYREHLGDACEIRYRVKKRIDRVELKFSVSGEKYDLFEDGTKAQAFRMQKTVDSVVFIPEAAVTYHYAAGYNILTVRSPRKKSSNNILRQPMLQAVAGGLVTGLLCRQLPPAVNSFIINEITEPILSVSLNILSGLLGPIVFLSIVKAVGALDSINELSGLGSKVIKRFFMTTLGIALISNIVGMVFFPLFGKGTIDFNPGTILSLIFAIIPTSLVTPFVENNIPQIVILGLGMGAVLLTMGDSARDLTNILSQLSQWLGRFMETINYVIPLVPLLSVFNIVANGEIRIFLKGWKYILAIYICMAICLLIKLIKVSRTCGISVLLLWKKMNPVVKKVFSLGSASSTGRLNEEIARNELGIDPDFSAFWVPLSSNMLSPSTTMSLVLAPFLVAEITGTPVSYSFLFIIMLLAVELSMASPGLTAGYTVIFKSLGMSAEYVGMFSVFSVAVKNCAEAFSVAYKIAEHMEAAYNTGHIDMSCCPDPTKKNMNA